MKNRASAAPGPSRPFAMELRNIWDVKADSSYDVSANQSTRDLIAIRTFAGEGELFTDGRHAMRITANSLILVEQTRIRRYRCAGASWEFWWFVLNSSEPLPCSLETVYPIAGSASDNADFKQIFPKLQSPLHATRCVASALFTTMFHRWLAEVKLTRAPSKHRLIIETIVERIHNDVSEDWPLSRLVKESGLCETLLRKEFRKATGKAPARFIHESRLQSAAVLIQQNVYTLAAIAEMLNFSSAFHLSSAFKKHFGFSPDSTRQLQETSHQSTLMPASP